MNRLFFVLALTTSLASGALAAQTPAVQRSARTTLYVLEVSRGGQPSERFSFSYHADH